MKQLANAQSNYYIESNNLLIFPYSKLRTSKSVTPVHYPDGRRFSEYNVNQLINSLVDYTLLQADGYVADYEYDSTEHTIKKLTLVIRGYIFQIDDYIVIGTGSTEFNNLYASILVRSPSQKTLEKQSECMLRVEEKEYSPNAYCCTGLILTRDLPSLDGATLTKMNDPTNSLINDYTLYTIPILKEGQIITHKLTSESIKNINGGTC